MNDDIEFHTVADHWQHFAKVDIDPLAPQVQREEMERAFMSGAISSAHLVAIGKPPSEVNAEIQAWQASWNARKGVRSA